MKSISEYNFREIVGKFVEIQFPKDKNFIDPKYEKFIAYTYIDIDAGISFRIYGGLINDEVNIFEDTITTVRYSPDMMIAEYEILTDEMEIFAERIDRNYSTDWINVIRDDTDFDPYRDKIFPDDMIIPVLMDYDNPEKEETLWVRPVRIQKNRIVVETIENGTAIPKGLQLLLVKESNENGNKLIFAVTGEWLERYNEEYDKIKGGTNEKEQ